MAPMITRCPACATRFRVVPDQLRISQGWVRCGPCGEIFDASAALVDGMESDATAEDASPATAGERLGSAPAAAAEAAPLPSDDAPAAPPTLATVTPTPDAGGPQWLPQSPAEIPVTDPAASLDVGYAEFRQGESVPAMDVTASPGARGTVWIPELHRRSAEPEPPAAAPPEPLAPASTQGPERLVVAITPEATPWPLCTPAKAPPASDMPLPQRPAASGAAPTPPAPAKAAPVPPPLPPPPPPPPPPPAPALPPEHAELSFLRDAVAEPEPAAAAASGRQRALWSGLAALALLLLALQWLVHERHRLAASAPALRPLLNALCAPLSCRVEPPRRIDAIVIDGSSFYALGESGYRLSLTLRNRAAHPVALPALVLALTDISEQAVVRRVLLPDELGQPPAALQAHGEWTTSVDLRLADSAGRARVVGYRLDPFYP